MSKKYQDGIDLNIRLSWAVNNAVEVITHNNTTPLVFGDGSFDGLVDFFLNYYDKKKAELLELPSDEQVQFFEDLKASVAKGVKMQVSDWEKLTVEQQEYFQNLKRANNRAKYQEDKKLGPIKRFDCNVCGSEHASNIKKCPEEDAVVGNGSERGSKFGGGDVSALMSGDGTVS